MGAAGCPGREELEGFAVGALAGDDCARVAGHVEGCSECEATLQSLDRLADPFISRLRASTLAGCLDADPIPTELIASLRDPRPRGEDAWLAPGEGPRRLGKFELLD